MTAYSAEVRDDLTPPSATPDRRYQIASGAIGCYRIDVVACSVEDLVRSAGGWLFDQINEGWTVNATMTDARDVRPLQILGLRTISTDTGAGSITDVPHPLGAADALLASDARVRGRIVGAFNSGEAEVTLWGGVLSDDLSRGVRTVHHRLSAAARIFKAQALLAASLPHESVTPTEALYIFAGSSLSEERGLPPVERLIKHF